MIQNILKSAKVTGRAMDSDGIVWKNFLVSVDTNGTVTINADMPSGLVKAAKLQRRFVAEVLLLAEVV